MGLLVAEFDSITAAGQYQQEPYLLSSNLGARISDTVASSWEESLRLLDNNYQSFELNLFTAMAQGHSDILPPPPAPSLDNPSLVTDVGMSHWDETFRTDRLPFPGNDDIFTLDPEIYSILAPSSLLTSLPPWPNPSEPSLPESSLWPASPRDGDSSTGDTSSIHLVSEETVTHIPPEDQVPSSPQRTPFSPTPESAPPVKKRKRNRKSQTRTVESSIEACKSLSHRIFPKLPIPPLSESTISTEFLPRLRVNLNSQISLYFSHVKSILFLKYSGVPHQTNEFERKLSRFFTSTKAEIEPHYFYAIDWDGHGEKFILHAFTNNQGHQCEDLRNLVDTASPYIRFSKFPLIANADTLKDEFDLQLSAYVTKLQTKDPELFTQL
ncbi:hypothetical protein H4R33_002267 [Dimargaris cristalligena]|nr:hypothetical protein H4R33_002267 [Dimargaris cristalligena]